MKKILKISVISVLSLVLLTSIIGLGIDKYQKNRINEYSDNVNSLINDNKMNLVTISDFNRLSIEPSSIELVYVGRATCPECQKFMPALVKSLNNKDISINYFDTDNNRDESGFDNVVKKYKLESVPYLMRIENGKVISYLKEYDDVEKINKWLES